MKQFKTDDELIDFLRSRGFQYRDDIEYQDYFYLTNGNLLFGFNNPYVGVSSDSEPNLYFDILNFWFTDNSCHLIVDGEDLEYLF